MFHNTVQALQRGCKGQQQKICSSSVSAEVHCLVPSHILNASIALGNRDSPIIIKKEYDSIVNILNHMY